MKNTKFITIIFSLIILISCEKDDVREELPGTPTTISGNVKDYHRNINVENFEIKLIKVWSCSGGGLYPNYCQNEIAKVITDINGNYHLNFEYNLREDEWYRIELNDIETNNYFYDFVSSSGEFPYEYDISYLTEGEDNIININAYIPIKLKFNLTVINNHTPPLNTAILYNGDQELGTRSTYNESNTFEIRTRPNSEVNIKFWYIENYNSSNPIFHYAPFETVQTTENEITELDYEVDCNEF